MTSHSSTGPTPAAQPIRFVCVVRGGPAPDARVLANVHPDSYVVAVDRGYEHARALGLRTDVVIGDLDSLSCAGLTALRASGVRIEQHRIDKDATDLELALAFVADVAEPGAHVTVIGGTGWEDRFDHVAAQLGLLASARWSGFELQAYFGDAVVRPVHAGTVVTLAGSPGALLSLIPSGGPAVGVTTTGLRFALVDDTLSPFDTRGVSNVFVDVRAGVAVREGVLLAITPHSFNDALEGAPS